MPLYGTPDITQAPARLPTLAHLDTEAWTLPKAEVMQLLIEVPRSSTDGLLPKAMHPALPSYVILAITRYSDSPVGPFNLAMLRLGSRAGAHPRVAASLGLHAAGYASAYGSSDLDRQITDRIEKKLQETPYYKWTRTYSKPGESLIVLELQDTAAPHETVAAPFVQAPLVQVPVLPHGALAGHWPAGAAVPAARFVHVPGVVPAQVWQVGQVVLPAGSDQQTPLTQLPLMHWLAAVQAWPGGLSAQFRLGATPWQVNGARQCESIEHVLRQAPVPHVYGEQLCVLAGAQVPVLIGIGVVVGAGLTLAGSKASNSLLFGLKPRDPLTFVLAIVILAAIGFGASFIPARRATRVDPMAALRDE